MIEIRRILCPTDFSDFSRRAFDHAVAIARWYESAITLLHVCPVAPAAAYGPGVPMLPSPVVTGADREELLESLRRFARTEAGLDVPVDVEVGEGRAPDEILGWAARMPSDLIVMGTHGRSGFERLLLGSVTERVLRKASCPVLSVPRSLPDAAPLPTGLFRHILCAIDFSDCSMQALTYAMSLAQEADAHLTVQHVLEFPPELRPDVPDPVLGATHVLKEYVGAIEKERRARLHDAVPESVRTYCTVDTVVVVGKAYQEILRLAAARQTGLIVIGIHGRGAADLLFFGSTAQHVVRSAHCPVLTLRRDRADGEVPADRARSG